MRKVPDSVKVSPPENVLRLARQLRSRGFDVWCVGGAVRDALLGHAHLDWDLATDARPEQVREVFGHKRTIPIGVDFGTVGVLDAAGTMHEVTTFRRDVRTDGRHAEVEFGASLDQDLARRDFTINAIAVAPESGELRDPFGGKADLERAIVRAVGEPGERMREDRLRALRALRFAARFEFDIDGPTWEAIRASAPHLGRLSAERVRQEIEKTMDQVDRPSRAFALWRDAGALAALIPELGSPSDETLASVDRAARPGLPGRPGRRVTRLALLFSELSEPAATRVTTKLKFSKSDSAWIVGLIGLWRELRQPLTDAIRAGGTSDEQMRRLVARIGRVRVAGFFRLAAARWAASRSADGSREGADQRVARLYRRALLVARDEPIELADLAIDGDDLRALGIAPGPVLGKILQSLLEQVLRDPALNAREALMKEAKKLADTIGLQRSADPGKEGKGLQR